MGARQAFDGIPYTHTFDQWAEQQTLVSAKVIHHAAADILRAAKAKIVGKSLQELVLWSNSVREEVVALTHELLDPLASELIDSAKTELATLIEMKIAWTRQMQSAPIDGGAPGTIADISRSAIPFGVTAAMAATLPAIAVSTTTVLFGLATVATVSWPVVAAGSALAALGLATGVIETTKIRARAEARLRKQISKFLTTAYRSLGALSSLGIANLIIHRGDSWFNRSVHPRDLNVVRP